LAILPKIREVDEELRGNLTVRAKVREVHPELLFWALNEGKAMSHPKKRVSGRMERVAVLERYMPSVRETLRDVRSDYQRSAVQFDDVVDAMAAAVTARSGRALYRTCPEVPDRDAVGLPMEMVYWKPERSAVHGRMPSRGTR
jgi:predicted RNase H-like nuclease